MEILLASIVILLLLLITWIALYRLYNQLQEVRNEMATQKDLLKTSVTSLEEADLALKSKSSKIQAYITTLLASVASLTQQVHDLEVLANVDLSEEIARIDAVTAEINVVAAELDTASTPA